MNKKIYTGIIIISILIVLSSFAYATTKEEVLSKPPVVNVTGPTWFENILYSIFGYDIKTIFTIVGQDRLCDVEPLYRGSGQLMYFARGYTLGYWSMSPGVVGGDSNWDAAKYCASGHGLFDVYCQTNPFAAIGEVGSPRFEMQDYVYFNCLSAAQGGTCAKCNVELYCCPSGDCSRGDTCPSGTTCQIQNAVDGSAPLKDQNTGNTLSSYGYCQSANVCTEPDKTCWRRNAANTACESATYKCDYPTYVTIVSTNCASGAGSYTYNSQSSCQSTICTTPIRDCIAANTCAGTQTCSNGAWGTCTTTLTKCNDGICAVTCGGTGCDYGSCTDVTKSCNPGVDCPTKCGTIGNSAGKIVECLPPSLGSCWANSGLPCTSDCGLGYFGTCTLIGEKKCGTDGKQILSCEQVVGKLCWSDAGYCGASSCLAGNCTGSDTEKVVGEACSNDMECESRHCDRNHWYSLSETCQPIPWDEVKRMSMTRKQLGSATTQEMISVACVRDNQCLGNENYSADCIPLSKLKDEGTIIDTNSFLTKGLDIISSGTTGGAVGGIIGGLICAGGVVATVITVPTVAGAAVFGTVAATACSALITGGAIIGATQGIKGGISATEKDPIVQALKAGDTSSVGLCVINDGGGGNWCSIAEKLDFIPITNNPCTNGSIIIAILVLIGVVILTRL